MEAKQHTLEKPTDHRINQKGNQNVHRNKQKLKHNPKSMGSSRQEYWSGVPLPSPIYRTFHPKNEFHLFLEIGRAHV